MLLANNSQVNGSNPTCWPVLNYDNYDSRNDKPWIYQTSNNFKQDIAFTITMILIHVRFEFVVKESDSKNNLQHVLVNAFATKPTYGWGEGRDFFYWIFTVQTSNLTSQKNMFQQKQVQKSYKLGYLFHPRYTKMYLRPLFLRAL